MLALADSFLASSRSDTQTARNALTTAADSFRNSGDRWALSPTLAYLAYTATALGDLAGAAASLRESTGLARELGTTEYHRLWLARIHLRTGSLEDAERELSDVAKARTSSRISAMAHLGLAEVARHRGDIQEAANHHAAAKAQPSALTDAPVRSMLHAGRARLALAHGRPADAAADLEKALDLATAIPDMPMVADIAVAVADLTARHGQPSDAAELLGAAHSLRGARDASDLDVARLTRLIRDQARTA